MKLISYLRDGKPAIGAVINPADGTFIDVSDLVPGSPSYLRTLIALGDTALNAVRTAIPKADPRKTKLMKDVTLLPVIPDPSQIPCMGLNYADHAKEGGRDRPEYPGIFMRGPNSLVGHNQPLVRPKASHKFDYEAELVIIVGKRARHLTKENALDCIAGYTLFNDGSARDYQRKGAQWTPGKNFDRTGGLGPWMVTPDEVPPGCETLSIEGRLNGQVMQKAPLKDMLWNVRETLVIISEYATLEPGDVIPTGTPAGVGYPRNPPVFMKPGDVFEVEVKGVGTLRNTVVDEV
jgi:2-keto-4-pentenoate hydratase/2-oxohepta-3-ene-1,7-dioic acid hydratase in catechol pathway